jgi:hypothetical protein
MDLDQTQKFSTALREIEEQDVHLTEHAAILYSSRLTLLAMILMSASTS